MAPAGRATRPTSRGRAVVWRSAVPRPIEGHVILAAARRARKKIKIKTWRNRSDRGPKQMPDTRRTVESEALDQPSAAESHADAGSKVIDGTSATVPGLTS